MIIKTIVHKRQWRDLYGRRVLGSLLNSQIIVESSRDDIVHIVVANGWLIAIRIDLLFV